MDKTPLYFLFVAALFGGILCDKYVGTSFPFITLILLGMASLIYYVVTKTYLVTKKNSDKELKKVNSFAKFSSAGIQMGVLIVAGVYFGEWLDKKFEFESPWMTITFALLGVFMGLYIVIREVIKMSK